MTLFMDDPYLQVFNSLRDIDPLDGGFPPKLLNEDSLLLKIGKLKKESREKIKRNSIIQDFYKIRLISTALVDLS
jgi:hypothetical protein